MNKVLSLVALSSVVLFNSTYSMEERHVYTPTIRPYLARMQDITNVEQFGRDEAAHYETQFLDLEQNEIDIAINNAPLEIRQLLNNILQDQQTKGTVILLTGETGIGKTILARSIGQFLRDNRNYNYIPLLDTQLKGEVLGSGAHNLRRVFEPCRSEKCIMMIDYLDSLVPYDYDEETVIELCRSLDNCLQNRHFVLVATADNCRTFPQILKNHLEGNTYIIQLPNFNHRKDIIKHTLQKKIERLANECIENIDEQNIPSENFVEMLARESTGMSLRSIEDIIYDIINKKGEPLISQMLRTQNGRRTITSEPVTIEDFVNKIHNRLPRHEGFFNRYGKYIMGSIVTGTALYLTISGIKYLLRK